MRWLPLSVGSAKIAPLVGAQPKTVLVLGSITSVTMGHKVEAVMNKQIIVGGDIGSQWRELYCGNIQHRRDNSVAHPIPERPE